MSEWMVICEDQQTEIDRLRTEVERVREAFIDQQKLEEHNRLLRAENAELRECIQQFVTEWDTGWEDDGVDVWEQSRAILAKTAKEG